MKYTTTLKRLRDNDACKRGYDLIAAHVGHDYAGDIDLLTILDVNGLDDCVWAMRATDGGSELATAFAIYCVEMVYTDAAWLTWAENWMSGKDRSATAAATAAAAVARHAVAVVVARHAVAAAAVARHAVAVVADSAWPAAAATRAKQVEILRSMLT